MLGQCNSSPPLLFLSLLILPPSLPPSLRSLCHPHTAKLCWLQTGSWHSEKPLKVLIIGKEKRADIKEIDAYSLLGFPDLFCTHSPAPLPFYSHPPSLTFCLSFVLSNLCSAASIKLYPPALSYCCQLKTCFVFLKCTQKRIMSTMNSHLVKSILLSVVMNLIFVVVTLGSRISTVL